MPGDDSLNTSETKFVSDSNQNRDLVEGKRSVAAIDIGSNSIHLLIAEVDTNLHTFTIQLAEKSTTRLGEVDPDSGELTESAMLKTIAALGQFKELALSHNVEAILTAATSAVREASNCLYFLGRINDELAMDVDIVSGFEEARLIYLGVLSGMKFQERPHILLDIGGGSTELSLADSHDARALTSTRVGAVRLTKEFINEDPISTKRCDFLRTFIQGSFEPAVRKVLKRIKSDEKPVMIATSGTAMAIGGLAAFDDGQVPLGLNGYKLTKDRLDDLFRRLAKMTNEERKSLPSLNERRAEIIVPGALILQTVMQMLSLEELVLSERALREGLIFDWMLRRGFLDDRFNFQSSIRQRTVIHLANCFGVDLRRSERVASFALRIYDKTYGSLHTDDGIGRELLWAAAILHACGQHINITGFHKHSWYLIRHGELLGYSQSEHLMVASIARYHRRSLPKKKHESWQQLVNKEHRKIVADMSIILRLAASLDRRPEPAISNIQASVSGNKLVIKLIAENFKQSLGLESWSLKSCYSTLEEAKGMKLIVES